MVAFGSSVTDWVNVKTLGAVGNGVANDSGAFSAAASALPNGGAIYVPQGTYNANITLTGRSDIVILGAGTGTVLAPASGAAVTLAQCQRIQVQRLKISGAAGAATGISVTGNFDGRLQDLYISGLTGDGIVVNGDDATGLEMTISDVTCRNNGGWGYHHTRTTTTDRGGVYLHNVKCNYDSQGLGGFKLSSSAGSATPIFHSFTMCSADGYVGGTGFYFNNVAQCRASRLWSSVVNNGGSSVLIDGASYEIEIDGAHIENPNGSGGAAGCYALSVNGTAHDMLFDSVNFDSGQDLVAYIHVGSTGANFILGDFTLLGSSIPALTDTFTALFNTSSYVQSHGPQTIYTAGNATSQCLGLVDPAHPTQGKWLKNANGSFQIANAAFNQTEFRVDDGGFVFAGAGIMPFGNNAGACTLYSGSGAPGTGLGSVGDYYFRSDTPSTGNQRIYVKTGSSAWTGIV